jgi:hypothetical protein
MMNKSQIIDHVLGHIAKAKIYFEEKGFYYLNENKEKKGTTYTGFMRWPLEPGESEADEEEIDVRAKNPKEAREIIKAVLKEEYKPSTREPRIHLKERFGLYF